jgi:hypothetical protein
VASGRRYIATTETYRFPLAVAGGGEFPPGIAAPGSAIPVLEESPDTRVVVFESYLFSPDGEFVRLVPPTNGGPNTATIPVPYIVVAMKQGPIGGEVRVGSAAGVGQGNRFAHIVTPEVPVTITLPPQKKMFASQRGAAIPPPPATPLVSDIFLSVTTMSFVEPEVDGPSGQAGFVLRQVRSMLLDELPAAIAKALQKLSGR